MDNGGGGDMMGGVYRGEVKMHRGFAGQRSAVCGWLSASPWEIAQTRP